MNPPDNASIEQRGWFSRRVAHVRAWLGQGPALIEKTPGLRWLGPKLSHPDFWKMSRTNLAKGAAVGVFFGLTLPFGHTPFVMLACAALRAYIPAAVLATFVNTPLTLPLIYWASFKCGDALFVASALPVPDGISSVLALTFCGSFVLGVGFALLTYLACYFGYKHVSGAFSKP
ncbi:DUF2062 domain-containing protein [Limnobacter sp.]|uniref:DUF2062 domain-containing protein n=1 Tax=Limnobacter sp. TaxID=2003368 RepID=UPI0025836997|nr:DUF2062 domain-containing protein [Limnobacter sp.]